MKKIVTVIGARPQFIKAAVISRLIRGPYAGDFSEVLVHTGQHYDFSMSRSFFEELDLPDEVRHKLYRGNAEKLFGWGGAAE